uniref:E3 ubiquitin-protein ligase parkin n=1 Tax=Photinus pyralis TaxID=7054 RepID=A0A1Y1L9R4_PHOPY
MTFLLNFFRRILDRMLQLFYFGQHNISNTLNIYVKTNNGNTLSINLDPQWDIKNVKEVVAPKLGLHPEEVKIIFAGKELGDTITIAECDLGQCSILHAVKSKHRRSLAGAVVEEVIEEFGSKPLCETLKDLSTEDSSNNVIEQPKAHFFVYCSICKGLKTGKLRVKCQFCKSGAFTVHADPQSWVDVLESKRITGQCENDPDLCANILDNAEPTFAEFYFKCAEHTSLGEEDKAVPLDLIRPNVHSIPCLACGDISTPILVFPCAEAHVTCLECFVTYCSTRLRDRQFLEHPDFGYTLSCPARCENSLITETHHFRLMPEAQYSQYQQFATEEFVLSTGGVLCPQPGCGMGIIPEPDCIKIRCTGGCGVWSFLLDYLSIIDFFYSTCSAVYAFRATILVIVLHLIQRVIQIG